MWHLHLHYIGYKVLGRFQWLFVHLYYIEPTSNCFFYFVPDRSPLILRLWGYPWLPSNDCFNRPMLWSSFHRLYFPNYINTSSVVEISQITNQTRLIIILIVKDIAEDFKQWTIRLGILFPCHRFRIIFLNLLFPFRSG